MKLLSATDMCMKLLAKKTTIYVDLSFAGDCNSLAETHVWFDSRVAHHVTVCF